LNILYPNPPKICFPKIIATNEPIATIQRGEEGGKTKAKNIPVTIELRSPTVIFLPHNLCQKNSLATEKKMLTETIRSARHPKKIMEANKAGESAKITSDIIVLTSSFALMCGETETINL
jgi:hypothetical protein